MLVVGEHSRGHPITAIIRWYLKSIFQSMNTALFYEVVAESGGHHRSYKE